MEKINSLASPLINKFQIISCTSIYLDKYFRLEHEIIKRFERTIIVIVLAIPQHIRCRKRGGINKNETIQNTFNLWPLNWK